MAPATALARATGIKLRGFHSKSSSSTASKTAATGDANVADMPAAAPATSRVFRSLLVRRKNCAISEPKAPPVIIMGPSAPKGPPEPIEMAADSGFKKATRGSTRLPIDEDSFDGFGNAMPADTLRSIACHEANDQGSYNRYEHNKQAQHMAGWRHERHIPALKKEEIREQADQPEECQGDESAEHPNATGETREQQDTPGGSKISERTQGVLMANVAVCVGRW